MILEQCKQIGQRRGRYDDGLPIIILQDNLAGVSTVTAEVHDIWLVAKEQVLQVAYADRPVAAEIDLIAERRPDAGLRQSAASLRPNAMAPC